MSKVIVIGSQKGGVGKTTTTLNLAYSLCSMGKKVLAIDLDSQASKTAMDEALRIEKFFRSPWYQQLTSVDGEFLIRRLQDEIRQSE